MASHGHGSSKHGHTENRIAIVRKLHKDWRLWVGVLLMLAAILTYVLTLDDSTIPR
jgi:hypothetical protein